MWSTVRRAFKGLALGRIHCFCLSQATRDECFIAGFCYFSTNTASKICVHPCGFIYIHPPLGSVMLDNTLFMDACTKNHRTPKIYISMSCIICTYVSISVQLSIIFCNVRCMHLYLNLLLSRVSMVTQCWSKESTQVVLWSMSSC